MKVKIISCKKCDSKKTVKNGKICGVQRYKCKECGYNFRKGDKRTSKKIRAKKALCILMYSKGKNSFRMIGDILKTDHTLVYRWIRKYAESMEEPKVNESTEEIEFDEMWHFIGSKKTNSGS
jgi:transposase